MLEAKLKELFATVLKESSDSISDETRPDDLVRWDSLQHMILVASAEEDFDIVIEPEEAVEMYADFGTFKGLIEKKVNGSA